MPRTVQLPIRGRPSARKAAAVADQRAGIPNADNHHPDPAYLRNLIALADLTMHEAARRLGLGDRIMRYYLSDTDNRPAPYPVQFCLESLHRTPRSTDR